MAFGYTFIWVDDVPATVAFLEAAFGLQRRSIRENGPLGLYAEMETGATTLAIADTKEAHHLFPAGYRPNQADLPPAAFQLTFTTEDVPATFAAALAAGATPLMDPSPSHGAKPSLVCVTRMALPFRLPPHPYPAKHFHAMKPWHA